MNNFLMIFLLSMFTIFKKFNLALLRLLVDISFIHLIIPLQFYFLCYIHEFYSCAYVILKIFVPLIHLPIKTNVIMIIVNLWRGVA